MMRKKLASLFTLLLVITLSMQAQTGVSLLEAGPMLGHVEMQEANLWIQTTKPVPFELRFWKKSGNGSTRYSYSGTTKAGESNTAHIKLSDLDYGTTYQYEFYLDGQKLELPYQTEFTTQQLWQWRRDAPDFTIALGSCLYINDSQYDRPGDPYGQGADILTKISEQNPDLMLWLGDNLYYREPDFYSESRMDYRYKDARNTPQMQELLAQAVNLAIWDDHDYGPNNSDRSYRMKQASLDIFKRYWANPGYGIAGTDGVFTRYKYNDVEFFFMDDRYHRAPDDLEKQDRDFFGPEQLQWLKDGLVNSNATFKLVMVGNQVTNKMNDEESLYAYHKEYNELMSYLDEQDIPGVVFLSGDRHFTELLKTNRGNDYPIYEFTSSPLSSSSYSSIDESEEYDNPQRVDGTLVYKDQNFGMIRVTGKRNHRKLILQTYDSKGKKRWEYTISENDLKD